MPCRLILVFCYDTMNLDPVHLWISWPRLVHFSPLILGELVYVRK